MEDFNTMSQCGRYRLCGKVLHVLFCLILCAFINYSYANGVFVSLVLKSATVDRIASEVRRQTSYEFSYAESLGSEFIGDVSINISDESIEKVLGSIFAGSEISYRVVDNIVLLSKNTSRPSSTARQGFTVTGTVRDENGSPIIGVIVSVKGGVAGTVTDSDGEYTISIPSGDAVIVYNHIGFLPQEITVEGRTAIDVTLVEDIEQLEDVVVVGYGITKRANLTGSVATIQSDDITVAPVSNVTNALSGRLPGLITTQVSGQPGSDAANLSIRGFGNALVIVDGIESSITNIDANQIESISILKDGSASIYGARAGNGVILVTTKRGQEGKPTITFNASGTLQGITIMPDPVNAGQYAELQAEEWLQSGQNPELVPYTPEQIQKYYDGNDPLYPSTNWRDELIRNWAPQQQYNLSVRGGSEQIKYYGFVGFLDQESMWKNNGGNFKRYSFQSNVDAKILDNLSLELTLAGDVENGRFPERSQTAGTGGVWSDFWQTLPTYPAHLPDPTKIPYAGGGGIGGIHVTSNSAINGYNNSDNFNVNATMALKYDFKNIKGLSLKAFGNYSQYFLSTKRFLKPVTFYTYNPSNGQYTLAGSYNEKAQLRADRYSGRTLTGQFSANYDRVFGEKHRITALALFEAIDSKDDWLNARRIDFITPSIDQMYAGSTSGMSNDGSASEMGRLSYVGRLNYAYDDKYLMEVIMRADASAMFPPNHRWGLFPSVSVGWRISEENFMEEVDFVDALKLRASYGESGDDGVLSFQWLSGYSFDTYSYILGSIPEKGLYSTGLANENLTWERMKIYNVGIDFALFKRMLYGELDIFYREREGIPATRLITMPSTFGAVLPQENLNSQNNRGFEIMLGSARKFGRLYYDVSANISWSRAKWMHFEEPEYTDPDQERLYRNSGRWTDRQIGYLSNGLFTSLEEVDALGFNQDQNGNTSLRPGDVRFIDRNGDTIFDWKDQQEIGKGTVPHWVGGFNINLSYANFDFSALFQGAFGYYKYIMFDMGESVPSTVVFNERWTETNNNPNAIVPRLGGAGTNGYGSDYYYKKAGYLRLKTVSWGYSLPAHWVSAAKLEGVRFYLAGTNLLTFDKLKRYKMDPEAPSATAGRYYPQQRTITLGVNLTF